MAHYNLFETLRVDRSADSDSLAREIDARIADESGDEVNIAALRQIAAGVTTSGPRGGAPAAAEDAPETRVEAPESAAESQTEQPVGIPTGNPAEQQNYQQGYQQQP